MRNQRMFFIGSRTFFLIVSIGVCLGVGITPVQGAGLGAPSNARSDLSIQCDHSSNRIVVQWSGKGRLTACNASGGRFRPMKSQHGKYVVEPVDSGMMFRLESGTGGVVSQNIVGYYILDLPPGLSLIAYQFNHTNFTLGFQWPEAPDGAQFFKYTDGQGYEVSTFDGLARAWSNPDLELLPGEAYYFSNPTGQSIRQLFVGEVFLGTLVNPIPAGLSAKASLLPQEGSINTLHEIPGEPGDEIRTYTNDGQGGGFFNISVYSEVDNAWVPDLSVRVGEGFWIRKQRAVNWIRIFNPF